MRRIAVVGGGIAGLAAAHVLHKQAPDARITLLEAGPRWGGKIAGERVGLDGGVFIVEGGPDSFLASKPATSALCNELGLTAQLQATSPTAQATYVLNKQRLLPLPAGLTMMVPTDLRAIVQSGLLSWPGKARLALDLLLRASRRGEDESLGACLTRRFGREAYENLLEPLLSGIYAGDGDQLSLASTFPRLREFESEQGSLIRGARQARASQPAPKGASRSTFLTPAGGLSDMVTALVRSLEEGVELRLNTPVLRIFKNRPGFDLELPGGGALEVDAVILATPAYAAAGLLEEFDPPLAAALAAIPYASTATISLAYRMADLPGHALQGYGYVIPRSAGRPALACTFSSSKFAGRAPQGYALLRVFIGRAGRQEQFPRNADELVALARDELRSTLGVRAEPLFARAFLWERGMPQYNLGHPELLAGIERLVERHVGLALAGSAYRGVGIPDCIVSGQRAAARVLNSL